MTDIQPMYFDGRWHAGGAGSFVVDDPSTGLAYAHVGRASTEQLDLAVAAARQAFDSGPWPRMSTADRVALMRALSDRIRADAAEFAEIIIHEVGSPVREAMSGQVVRPLNNFEGSMVAALEYTGQELRSDDTPFASTSRVVPEPIGVVVSIPAFNYPLNVVLSHIGASLAAGNTVVIRPSPLAPVAVLGIARLAGEVGFPPGVVNVVTGDDIAGSQYLIGHRGTDMIVFTGSSAVGRAIMVAAAPRLKRLVLELGGKSPSVLLDDGDVELAVRTTLSSTLRNAGQNCVNIARFIVPRELQGEVVELAVRLAEKVKIGPATDPSTEVGPLITAAHVQTLETAIAAAERSGAKVATGGERLALAGGHYFKPTVITDEGGCTVVSCEEMFGPVLTVTPHDGVDHAVALANATDYGLAGSVWGRDTARAEAVAGRIRSGTVWINTWGVVGPRAPFGGFKQSGIGRLYGEAGAREFTESKHVYHAVDTDQVAGAYYRACAEW